jgi:hypothetical protein
LPEEVRAKIAIPGVIAEILRPTRRGPAAGRANIVGQMKSGVADASTKKRVAQSWLYIKDNAVFPRPVVTMKIPDGLSLLDGSHRTETACVGAHSAGQVPLA